MKDKRIKQKKNKWLNLLITLTLLVGVLLIAGYNFGSMLSSDDFKNIENIISAFDELKNEVNEDSLVTYKIDNYEDFKSYASSISLNIFDESGNISSGNVTHVPAEFVIPDKLFGGVLYKALGEQEKYSGIILKQFKLTRGTNGLFQMESIAKLSFESEQEDISLYFTTKSTISSTFQILSSKVYINELDESSSNLVVSTIKGAFEKENKDINKYINVVLVDILTTFSDVINCDMTVVSGEIYFRLK